MKWARALRFVDLKCGPQLWWMGAMKDVSENFLDERFPAYRYAGNNNIRTELLKDVFSIKKDMKIFTGL